MSGFEEEHFVSASRLAAVVGDYVVPAGAKGQKLDWDGPKGCIRQVWHPVNIRPRASGLTAAGP